MTWQTVEELRRRKEELTRAILESEQQRGETNKSTKIESELDKDHGVDVENKDENDNAEEDSLLQKDLDNICNQKLYERPQAVEVEEQIAQRSQASRLARWLISIARTCLPGKAFGLKESLKISLRFFTGIQVLARTTQKKWNRKSKKIRCIVAQHH